VGRRERLLDCGLRRQDARAAALEAGGAGEACRVISQEGEACAALQSVAQRRVFQNIAQRDLAIDARKRKGVIRVIAKSD
jgi:hypothetical protein